ncbi:hypothetical protein [Synechococcus elongatus]|uniref:Uncharacterized protein n=2 Tax=Synechococcus elongatus TaxID=32046 RepID=Q31QY7_SYNE7|nr:hypothetical protein [Synechococcus elongatus]ABB56532.1 hypothetical protein Synpcc7942_0500 [Synechococcus elongatus PCC 7942 = FACHB-805]AJD56426.1 hypothetical protein M744_00460 [Synechococcus elongatus UTEX 2973]MBD2588886.1 hypothetical protein [Synechococcus elongatus FACHB-242]MBD2689952.1 hypothetical protein [Synechococcus elongatus FACHB-1061]MBD2706923.1 hypothetical protein [Synechococcus elongatus PCC 7942 = FACHB-805]
MDKRHLLGLAIGGIAIAGLAYWLGSELLRELTQAEVYPGPWQTQPLAELDSSLSSHNVPNCQPYRYRTNQLDPEIGEYLVACPTLAGQQPQAYLVLLPLQKVVSGPFPLDPSLANAP